MKISFSLVVVLVGLALFAFILIGSGALNSVVAVSDKVQATLQAAQLLP